MNSVGSVRVVSSDQEIPSVMLRLGKSRSARRVRFFKIICPPIIPIVRPDRLVIRECSHDRLPVMFQMPFKSNGPVTLVAITKLPVTVGPLDTIEATSICLDMVVSSHATTVILNQYLFTDQDWRTHMAVAPETLAERK